MALKWDGLAAEACSLWDVHKERSEHQSRFAQGNDDEGHAAAVGDPGATDVTEVTLEYAGTSDDNDGDYEAAADPAVVATAAAANATAANQAAAQAAQAAEAAQAKAAQAEAAKGRAETQAAEAARAKGAQ
jgi:hypothetical protein